MGLMEYVLRHRGRGQVTAVAAAADCVVVVTARAFLLRYDFSQGNTPGAQALALLPNGLKFWHMSLQQRLCFCRGQTTLHTSFIQTAVCASCNINSAHLHSAYMERN